VSKSFDHPMLTFMGGKTFDELLGDAKIDGRVALEQIQRAQRGDAKAKAYLEAIKAGWLVVPPPNGAALPEWLEWQREERELFAQNREAVTDLMAAVRDIARSSK
jgi:hypothetical protein